MIHKASKIIVSTDCVYKIETPQESFSTLLIPPGTAGPSGGADGKEPDCQCSRCTRHGFSPWVGQMPWRRAWQPTPVFLPGGSHGRGAWRATAHRVTKSWTQLKQLSMHAKWPLCVFSHREWFYSYSYVMCMVISIFLLMWSEAEAQIQETY